MSFIEKSLCPKFYSNLFPPIKTFKSSGAAKFASRIISMIASEIVCFEKESASSRKLCFQIFNECKKLNIKIIKAI